MQESIEQKFKKMLVESIDNDNEAARELAKETAIKMAGNFTEARLKEMLEEFSVEHIESRMFRN